VKKLRKNMNLFNSGSDIKLRYLSVKNRGYLGSAITVKRSHFSSEAFN
jgi:hypothetical protein